MIPALMNPQRDFSAGEIVPDAQRRDDTDIYKAGLRTARNVRLLNSGGIGHKPGRQVLFVDSGVPDVIRPTSDKTFDVTFSTGFFIARLHGSPAIHTSLAAPWTAPMMADLKWVAIGSIVLVVHRTMPIQLLTYTAATDIWTIAPLTFDLDLNGALKEPFYRFGAGGVTMTPSARTGAGVTITFSAATLVVGHVGVIFRYGGKQLIFTGFTSSTVGTATVLEELPETYDITVDTTGGFSVGEVVEGGTFGMKGQIVAIPSGTVMRVVLSKKAKVGAGEQIVGPLAVAIAGGGTPFASVAPAASTIWDEAFISPVRGYPGSVSFDAQRAIFCDFAQFPQAIIWSTISSPTNLKVTADADGAIFEYVPATCRVYNIAGLADQFILTDTGVYFIPVSVNQPLKPGSIEFRRIASDGASSCRPVSMTEGVIFANLTGTRIMGIRRTGLQTAPYEVSDLTEFHYHMINQPIAIASATGDTTTPERYIYVVNADGSMVVGRPHATKWVGWVRWEGAGTVRGVAALGSIVLVAAHYAIGAGLDTIELNDYSLRTDGSWFFASMATTPITQLAGATVQVVRGAQYLGEWVVGGDGKIVGAPTDETNVWAGFWAVPNMVPFVPNMGEGQSVRQRMRRRRVKAIAATVRQTQAFVLAGKTIAAWNAEEDQLGASPQRDTTYIAKPLGRSYDPEPAITVPRPGMFTINEIGIEATV